ncbi:MAG: hypothetical protein EXS31_12655 [Pedosphaera sp.]|nr:hypothetical protein [Pedosphaera sp.]
MKPRLYLETTIPSYLVARRIGSARISADQQTTQHWWDLRRLEFDVFISELVLDESASGDPFMAAARLEKLVSLPQLAQTHAVDLLAQRIIEGGSKAALSRSLLRRMPPISRSPQFTP